MFTLVSSIGINASLLYLSNYFYLFLLELKFILKIKYFQLPQNQDALGLSIQNQPDFSGGSLGSLIALNNNSVVEFTFNSIIRKRLKDYFKTYGRIFRF